MEMYGADRARRRLGLPDRHVVVFGEKLTTAQVAWLSELLADAPKSGRLSDWERSFIASIAQRFSVLGTGITLTERQMDILQRIEGKIHAAG